MNQFRTGPESPTQFLRVLMRILWSIVSKAALRSRSTKIVGRLESRLSLMSFVIFRRAVSVLWWGRKPDWNVSSILFVLRWLFSWERTVFSRSLLRN